MLSIGASFALLTGLVRSVTRVRRVLCLLSVRLCSGGTRHHRACLHNLLHLTRVLVGVGCKQAVASRHRRERGGFVVDDGNVHVFVYFREVRVTVRFLRFGTVRVEGIHALVVRRIHFLVVLVDEKTGVTIQADAVLQFALRTLDAMVNASSVEREEEALIIWDMAMSACRVRSPITEEMQAKVGRSARGKDIGCVVLPPRTVAGVCHRLLVDRRAKR